MIKTINQAARRKSKKNNQLNGYWNLLTKEKNNQLHEYWNLLTKEKNNQLHEFWTLLTKEWALIFLTKA